MLLSKVLSRWLPKTLSGSALSRRVTIFLPISLSGSISLNSFVSASAAGIASSGKPAAGPTSAVTPLFVTCMTFFVSPSALFTSPAVISVLAGAPDNLCSWACPMYTSPSKLSLVEPCPMLILTPSSAISSGFTLFFSVGITRTVIHLPSFPVLFSSSTRIK